MTANVPNLGAHSQMCLRIGEALWQAAGKALGQARVREGTKQALAIAYYIMPDARQYNIYEVGEALQNEWGGKPDHKRNVITKLRNAGLIEKPEQFELRGHQAFDLTLSPAGRRALEDNGIALPGWMR
jgi:hypothetical protein